MCCRSPSLLLAVLGALALAVGLRGPSGLGADVGNGVASVGRTGPGSVDVTGRELAAFALGRHTTLVWSGELRVPAPGRYAIWAEGRGRVSVRLAGRAVLESEGDPLRASTALGLAAGAIPLEVRFEHTGPGPRLRLEWTRPDGRRETIPPRFLGPPRPAFVWWLTDALALAAAALLGLVAWRAPWDVRRDVPSPRPVTAGELVASGAGYLLLLAVMSWPLAGTSRTRGRWTDPTAVSTRGSWPGRGRRSSRTRLGSSTRRPSTLRRTCSRSPRTCCCRQRWWRRCSGSPAPCSPTTWRSSRACCSPASASSSWCGARPATASPPSWRGRSSRPDPTAGRGCRTCTRRSRCSSRSRSSRSTASGRAARCAARSSSG